MPSAIPDAVEGVNFCNRTVCSAADFFHGDKPDLEAIFNGDFSGFMAWRERHAADTILPDADRVCVRP